MTMRTRTPLTILLSALAVATGLAATPQRAVVSGAHDAPLTATVPVDPRITVGTLANGMRYYIRVNEQPKNRAELRLVVNAGSVLEDDDQRGLAHFVEHMAFNGTKNFPKQEGIAFLQSTGMHFGAHINANTSFDQTVYKLQIPTDSPAVIDRSLLILEDWAHAVSFEPAEIDKERGVILEEWRTGLGAGRADSRRAAAGPAQGFPLCRSASDRQARHHPHLHLRAPEEVLHRLVSARSHGGDCRRRLRSGGDRDAHQVPLRLDSGCRIAAAAAGLRRARSAGHAVHHRDRPRGHRDDGRRLDARWPLAIRRPSAPTASR